jgi:hypothetical protein
MAKKLTHSQHLISVGGISLAGLSLGEAACHLHHLGCVAVRMALEMLPTTALLAWRASQGFVFDHPRLFDCLCQFVSVWSLLVCLVRSV